MNEMRIKSNSLLAEMYTPPEDFRTGGDEEEQYLGDAEDSSEGEYLVPEEEFAHRRAVQQFWKKNSLDGLEDSVDFKGECLRKTRKQLRRIASSGSLDSSRKDEKSSKY